MSWRSLSRGLRLIQANESLFLRRLSDAPKEKIPKVKGVSSKVLTVPPSEVGPGASKSGEYKNPEYFCYQPSSYFDAEIEMLKYRLPQPSSIKSN